jgi:hypothetical protein
MEYTAAAKKVKEDKPRPNRMVIKIGYEKIVLPFTEGLQLMAALSSVEQFKDQYNDRARIGPVDVNLFESSLMSAHEYEQYKIAAVLGVSVKDIKEMETTTV